MTTWLSTKANNTNGGKAFEEGGVPSVNNLRGSGSLKQLADNVISLSRNQMAEEESERNIVTGDQMQGL